MSKLCNIENCSNKIAARGWCWKHYARWRKHGDPLYVLKPKERPCDVSGCEDFAKSRGLCTRHYLKFRKYGDPLAGKTYYTDIEERFEAQTQWQGDCLVWTGSCTQDGYGYMSVNGKSKGVHRYVWELSNGPIPEGFDIDHGICHNRACCNVKHLRLAEPSDNKSHRKGPTKVSRSGIRNVYELPSGKFEVRIKRHGVEHRLGYFDSKGEAEVAAIQGRKELFGEFSGR